MVTESSTGSLHTPHRPVSEAGLTAAAAASAPAPVPVAECTTRYGWSTACRARSGGQEVVVDRLKELAVGCSNAADMIAQLLR